MALIFVTGVSGIGKSTIRKELQKHGYEAYDTDEDDISAYYNKKTKQKAHRPRLVKNRTKEWLKQHEWIMSQARVEELAKTASNKTIFLCGASSNQSEFKDLFAIIISLELDEDTLKHRLATRTTNSFGKAPDELNNVLSWHKWFEDRNRDLGAIVIDASQPIDKITDKIISIAESNN